MQCADRVLVDSFIKHMVEPKEEIESDEEDEVKHESGIESLDTSKNSSLDQKMERKETCDAGIGSLNTSKISILDKSTQSTTSEVSWDDVS